MAIRQAIGSALVSAHLETVPEHESAIDRVGALAHGSKLGRLLFHWKHAAQAAFAGPVRAELLRKARKRFRIARFHVEHERLVRACKQAMIEYYAPWCRECGGAGEVIAEKLRIVCHTCGGSGIRPCPDAERVAALKVDWNIYRNTWEPRMRELLLILDANDNGTAAQALHQLRDEH
jgi:hypothetical protein